MRARVVIAGVAAAIAVAAWTNHSGAETVHCNSINRVPFTIAKPGIYCLKRDVTLFRSPKDDLVVNAITINADGVVLDLNGHVLSGDARPGTAEQVAISSVDRSNITVRNGTVRGFSVGLSLGDNGGHSGGHLIEAIRSDASTSVGIGVSGNGIVVRNNQVLSTGGTAATNPVAIFVDHGTGGRIVDNDIVTLTRSDTGESDAIAFNGLGVTDTVAAGNRITGSDVGIKYALGATGKYRDNMTSGVTTPYVGGTDAGNND